MMQQRRRAVGLLMTDTVILLLVVFASFLSRVGCQSHLTEKIPIGALFDHVADEEVRAAFKHELECHSKIQSRMTIGLETKKVNTDDSYQVSSLICQIMNHGVFAFFASHTAATISTIRSYSQTFHMPFVLTGTPVNVSSSAAATPLTSSGGATGTPSYRQNHQPHQHQGFEMYIRPHYARAIVAIIEHYGWKDIWYIYNSDDGLERLQQLLDALTDAGRIVRQHIYRVDDDIDAYKTLIDVSQRDESAKHILVDLPTRMVESLLDKMNKDTRGMQNHYFVVSLGISDMSLNAFNHGGMNVTGFRLVDYNNSAWRDYYKGTKFAHGEPGCIGWEQRDPLVWPGAGRPLTFEAALAVDAIKVIQRGLARLRFAGNTAVQSLFKQCLKNGKVFNNGTDGKEGIDCDAEPIQPWQLGYELLKAMREVQNFVGLTGIVKFDKNGLRKDYKLDILEVGMNRGLMKIGEWKPDETPHLKIQHPTLVREKGNNTFANRTRIITSILDEPYLMRKKDANGKEVEGDGNDVYEGYCADLAKEVADFVGFDYIIKPVKDKKYGSRENGTWNGMVGELIRHEADLAIAPLTINADREKVIDFSKPFMSLGISIMIKKPIKENPGVFSFMNPLSYEIWMCVIFAYIGVSVVLFLVSRFSPFEWHIEDHTDGPSVTNNFTIFNSLWFSLGAFMQQGCDIEPRSMSGRIVGSVWWFFTLIIISSYTANLAAFLTVERMQSPIESAEDLAKQTEIKYGTVESGTTREFFKQSTIPVYERMWAFMTTTEPKVFVQTNDDGIARVRQGKYAFLIESTKNDYTNQRQPCDTMKVGSNLDSKGYGIATPRGSDLTDRITLAVLELSENEKLAQLEKTWWYVKGECGTENTPKNKQEATSSLKLPNVAGIFYILIGGLVMALMMATCEFLYKSKVEARRKKYTYTPTAQLISLDGYAETNTHTQV